MLRITPNKQWPILSTAEIRASEKFLQNKLPKDTPSLMESAGLALAKFCIAIAPNAKTIWIACGPGNNGGDGLIAAVELKKLGRNPYVTLIRGNSEKFNSKNSDENEQSFDHTDALRKALNNGIEIKAAPPQHWDLAVDALLGIGVGTVAGHDFLKVSASSDEDLKQTVRTLPNSSTTNQTRSIEGDMADWLCLMQLSPSPVICVDVPSGLSPETGVMSSLKPTHKEITKQGLNTNQIRYTLTFIGLKAGLFTHTGKDFSGEIWLESLSGDDRVETSFKNEEIFYLNSLPSVHKRLHDSHKGAYSDVVVIGGANGMQGAAILAATSALNMGAGRVYLCLLDPQPHSFRINPALMTRDLNHIQNMELTSNTVVCGCGGGDTVKSCLNHLLQYSKQLVLDADAINAIASDTSLQEALIKRASLDMTTVLTPHPLEAARLLRIEVQHVQSNRIEVAKAIVSKFKCLVVLKGAGTVIASENIVDDRNTRSYKICINPTGNALLSSAGTGDVLAGMIGSLWTQSKEQWESACQAVFIHGKVADDWGSQRSFNAEYLSEEVTYPRV